MNVTQPEPAVEMPATLSALAAACLPRAETRDHEAVRTLMVDLISEDGFAASVPPFGELESSPRGWTLGGEHVCFQSDTLTVMVLDTLPGVLQPPHNHEMHAIIGVFEGCEDQRFFARTSTGVAPTTTRSLTAGDVMVLGDRAIHAISSPADATARAIHVYFGDIYSVERSLFHPETLEAVAYTGDQYDEFCRPTC